MQCHTWCSNRSGIVSESRQELKNHYDYQVLFDNYEREVLPGNNKALNFIANLVNKKLRVALTCFEAEVCMCHRGRVAKAVESLPDWKYEVVHI